MAGQNIGLWVSKLNLLLCSLLHRLRFYNFCSTLNFFHSLFLFVCLVLCVWGEGHFPKKALIWLTEQSMLSSDSSQKSLHWTSPKCHRVLHVSGVPISCHSRGKPSHVWLLCFRSLFPSEQVLLAVLQVCSWDSCALLAPLRTWIIDFSS